MTTARVRAVDSLPLAGQLDGSEIFPADQGGAAVGVTTAKIAAAAASLVPPVSPQQQAILNLKANKADLGAAAYREVDVSGGVASYAYAASRAASGVNSDITSLEGPAGSGIKFKTGSTVMASAATVDIGNAPTREVVITGTAVITSFGTVANAEVPLRFTDAVTLTNNPTSLVLPRDANIVTAPGDTAVAVSNGSANWRLRDYTRASGKPIGGIGTQDANAVTFTGGSINGTAIGATTPSTVNATVFSLGGTPALTMSAEFRFLSYSSGAQMFAYADQFGAQAYFSSNLFVFRSANFATTYVNIAAARTTFNAAVAPGKFTVGTAPAGQSGDVAWFSNARKVGEAAGAGTGVLATYSNGAWRRQSDDTAIAA